tara:strand:- start:493 stop:1692 length:1200 start_codon:yes stop_codon:yes gene_type:complete
MRFALSIFYRDIIIDDLKNIPSNKPSIFACTHPNSFLDAIIIGAYSPRKLYFLARSDVFNTPFKMWLLSNMNLIPIYRLQEGAENLHKNEVTFAKCFEIMKKGGSILIFSEGISVTDKLVRPLKKGTARIAFGAEVYNNFKLDLQIIPMSLNYTYPSLFRSEVIVGIKEPIAVKKYQTLYEESEMKAIRQFNQDLYDGIKASSIIVDEKTDAGKTYEIIAPILRSELNDHKKRLFKEQQWAEKSTQENIISLAANYPMQPSSLLENKIKKKSVEVLNQLLVSLTFAIFWLIGYLPNAIPFVFAKIITKKLVKLIEFYASVRLCLSVVLYLIYLPIVSFIISSFVGINFALVAILFIALGSIYVKIRDEYRSIIGAKKFFSNENSEELISIRNKVITEFV